MFCLYLTGAPATGKSTVAEQVIARTGGLYVSYGALLTERLRDQVRDQTELRQASSQVITKAEVQAADLEVQALVASASVVGNVVVDSHALTRERYGFRAVPYSAALWVAMPFTHIVCLETPSEVIRGRVIADSGGRPLLSPAEFDRHTQLQAALALTYAHTGGLPIAFVDTSPPLATVVATVLEFVEAA